MEFGTGALKQVWYEIDHPFGNFPDQKKGWIAGRINDQNYIGTNGDPCPSVALPTEIRFPYDREAAARYAVEQGKQNNTNGMPNNQRVSQKISVVSNLSYAFFQYGALSSGTGSSVFLGESLWMGGMPMVIRDNIDSNNGCTSNETTGWRFCGRGLSGTGQQQTADGSQPWKFHTAQLGYYTNGIPRTGRSIQKNRILPDSIKGRCVGGTSKINGSDLLWCNPAVSKNTEIFGFNIKTGQIDPKKVNFPENFQTIKMGDYAWINSVSIRNGELVGDYHGLLVSGWGDLINCPDISESSSLFVFPIKSFVPYVVDFSGNGKNNSFQVSWSRPFYCTSYVKPNSKNFVLHDWTFFSLPDAVTIPPEKVFVPTDWSWTP
jgi:hypothetical protein